MRKLCGIGIFTIGGLMWSWAAIAGDLPNPQLTPGVTNPVVTQANIHQTICVRGWTKTIRPPEEYTYQLKKSQIAEYGYTDHYLRDYEEDHLIPLELGGNPNDPHNLWPEPRQSEWGSGRKDELENALNALVCSEQLPLSVAQQAIAQNWIEAYKRYVH